MYNKYLNLNYWLKLIYVFWGLWYVFFSSSLVLRPGYNVIWPALAIVGVIFKINSILFSFQATIKGKTMCWWLFTITICFLTLIYSIDRSSSLDYTVKLLLAFLYACTITSDEEYYEIFFKAIKVYLVALLGFSFLQLLSPSIYSTYVLPLLSQSNSDLVINAINSGEVVGFTNGTSQNGLYMTMGFVVFGSDAVVSKDKKKINIVLAVLFFVMTFVSGKRNYAIACVLLFIIMIGFLSNNKSGGFKWSRAIIAIIALYAIFSIASVYYEPLNTIVNKFNVLSSQGDITNGRFEIYQEAFMVIKDNWLFGIGVNSATAAIGGDVHSSYLQLILEFGLIFAWIPFLTVVLVPIKSYREIKDILNRNIARKTEFKQLAIAFLFSLLYLWAMLFAIPFQWTNITMLYMIMQLVCYGNIEKLIYYNQDEVFLESN